MLKCEESGKWGVENGEWRMENGEWGRSLFDGQQGRVPAIVIYNRSFRPSSMACQVATGLLAKMVFSFTCVSG